MQTMTAVERLGATMVGSGDRIVILANGLGTTQDSWRNVVGALTTRARVLRFDYVGMPSIPNAGYAAEVYASLYGYADDVVALLDELDVRDALFVGHSVSGMIGLIAAAAAPERIARLALIAASPCYIDESSYRGGFSMAAVQSLLAHAGADYHAWVAGFAPVALGADAQPDAIAEFTQCLQQLRPDVAMHVLRTIFLGDYRAVLPTVRQHVTLLQLQEDAAVPLSVGLYMHQHLPHAELVLLGARGHIPQLTAPSEVRLAICRVLDSWQSEGA